MGGGGVLQGYLATVGYYLLVLVTQIFSSRAWWGFETNSSLGTKQGSSCIRVSFPKSRVGAPRACHFVG
jgi:hypothetical protein